MPSGRHGTVHTQESVLIIRCSGDSAEHTQTRQNRDPKNSFCWFHDRPPLVESSDAREAQSQTQGFRLRSAPGPRAVEPRAKKADPATHLKITTYSAT